MTNEDEYIKSVRESILRHAKSVSQPPREYLFGLIVNTSNKDPKTMQMYKNSGFSDYEIEKNLEIYEDLLLQFISEGI